MREPIRSVPLQVLYGGASSGKSVFVAQRDVLDIVNEERNFLIVRKFANTIRSSVFEERRKIITEWGFLPLFDIRESDFTITYKPSGCVMMFRGLDDVEKVKSITVPHGVVTDLRVEEATECSEADIDQLGIRMRGLSKVPKRELYSFNPIFRSHWLCRKHFNGALVKYHRSPEKLIFHTTFRDNKFLTQQDRNKLLSCTGYRRDVYADGKWGVLGDLIFTNWEVADLSGRKFDVVRYGLDFGFTNDPSALLEVAIQSNTRTIYITREVYKHGATNDVLAAMIKPVCGDSPVWCDCAEPKSISEMHNQGVNRINSHPAAKGKDSVWHSIQWLQQWKVVIDRKCTNTVNEFSQYQWQKNKDGISLNEPVGTNDH